MEKKEPLNREKDLTKIRVKNIKRHETINKKLKINIKKEGKDMSKEKRIEV